MEQKEIKIKYEKFSVACYIEWNAVYSTHTLDGRRQNNSPFEREWKYISRALNIQIEYGECNS